VRREILAPRRGGRGEPLGMWNGKGISGSRKNCKIRYCLSFDCNPLPCNLFQPERETGILRIIRNFLRVGYMGERVVKRLKLERFNKFHSLIEATD
jgi:hypothetical protein